jgi:hypothetical protein
MATQQQRRWSDEVVLAHEERVVADHNGRMADLGGVVGGVAGGEGRMGMVDPVGDVGGDASSVGGVGGDASSVGGVVGEYQERLRAREVLAERLRGRHVGLGYLRLGLVAVFLVAVGVTVFEHVGPVWMAGVPFVLFVGVAVYHVKVLREHVAAVRAAEVYRLGLARVEDRWVGLRERAVPEGMAEAMQASLYASDLDVVGRGGLFELLCVARTRMGEETLLRWLLEPTEVSEVRARQEAVAELRGRLEFKERMAIAGEPERMGRRGSVQIGVQAAALRSWAEAPAVLRQGWMPWLAGVLAVVAVVGIVVWLKGISLSPLLLVLLVEAGVRRPFSKRIAEVLEGADRALEQMKLLSGLLEVMEAEGFEAGRLREIEGRLRGSAVKGSVAIAQLGRLGQYRDSMDNWFVKLLNLPLMYSVQLAWAMERWRGRHGRAVGAWLEAVAEMEALVSLATYSYEHPGDVFPEFVEERGWFEAEELGHPLIAAAKCVRNSVRMGGEVRVLVISGSNMSGKSTLMRTVGVNTVLAMCGAPVRARRLRLSALRMGASLLVNDSLQSGQSRFYAEIERLRRVCMLAESCAESYAESCADGESKSGESKSGESKSGESKSGGEGWSGAWSVMFLLDELLQGTNSKDRLVGARGVVRALVEAGAIGMVTTHDLALAGSEGLGVEGLRSMHFQDEIVDGEMRFDFRLREGVAMRSNGVELMRLIGLKV